MTLQNGPHEHLQEARKEAVKGCSQSRQDQHCLPSQMLHLQHPNSRIHIFWIKHIHRKKGINTCTHPATVQVCGKCQILLLHIEQAPKDAVRSKTPKNPHWSKHSARSEHLHSLSLHPLCGWELISNPWRHRQEFPLNFITEDKEQFHKTWQMASRLWHSGTTMRAWSCRLMHWEAARETGWNPGCDEVGGNIPTDFRQVWDLTHYWMSGQQPSTRTHSSLPSLCEATRQGSVATLEHQPIPQQAHEMLVSPGEVGRMEESP